jgi:glycosyltransferase involved in cell wall biosynthesis
MTEDLKVLHVINIGGYGGAEKLLLQLLPALNQQMVADCLILYKEDNPEAALKIASGLRDRKIEVYIYSYRKLLQGSIRKAIRNYAIQGKYDLVHGHLKQADFWLSILKKRGQLKIPVVSTMHGYNDAYENKYGFVIKKSLFFSPYYLVSRSIFRQLDGFILISNIVSEFFNRSGLLPRVSQKVIPHGYDTELIPEVKASLRSLQPRIAIPGRLIRRKGHLYAIEAVRQLKAFFPGITLHIYGDGPERQTLENKVRSEGLDNTVIFHGYVHDLLMSLRDMDVILIPSLWEGFGLVFLDAFAAGVPVVAFDLPAGNEIIRHGYNGLLATPYSSDSLVENIQLLMNDDLLRQKISMAARQELIAIFNMRSMTKAYTEFYKTVLSNYKKNNRQS